MALVHSGRWTLASVIDVRLTHLPPGRQPSGGQPPGTMRLPSRLTLHIGAARAVARVRMLGGRAARLSLDHPLPLHVGDRVLLRDPGAAADRAIGRPVFGATVLDVSPPRPRSGSWPRGPSHRRRRTCCAGTGCCGPARHRPWA
jgi:selenocysteine-specific elongation factor